MILTRGFFGRFVRPLPLAAALAILISLALLIHCEWTVRSDREAVLIEAIAEATTQTKIVANNLARLLGTIHVLQGLAHLSEMARQSANVTVSDAAAQQLALWKDELSDGIIQVGTILPTGYMGWTNIPMPGPPVYLGDREHFLAIARDRLPSFISTRLVGRVSRLPSINFTQGHYDSAGSLQTVSVVSLAPRILSNLAQDIGLKGSDAMAILRTDGAVLASIGVEPPELSTRLPLSANMSSIQMEAVSQPANSASAGGQPAIRGGNWRTAAANGKPAHAVAWREAVDHLIVAISLDTDQRLSEAQPGIDRLRQLTWSAIGLTILASVAVARFMAARQREASLTARAAAVQESARWFKTMADGLPYMVRLLSSTGASLYVNPAAKDILGMEPSEVINLDPTKCVHPEDLEEFFAKPLSAPRVGEQCDTQFRMLHADGHYVLLHSIVRRISTQRAGPDEPAFIATSRDITNEHLAACQLRAAKQDLEDTMAATPGVFFRMRRTDVSELEQLFVSPNIEKVLGFTVEEALQPGFMLRQIDAEAVPALREYLNRLEQGGESSLHYRIRHKAGHWIWLSAISRLVTIGDEKTNFGYAYDITREHEQNLHLAQMDKLAILGNLTTGMAHELNQPLAGISMIAENALAMLNGNDSVGRSLQQKLQRIVDQVARAASIIDHMRIFGRKADDAAAPFSIEMAIDGAIAILEGKCKLAAIDIVRDIPSNLPQSNGSLVMIEQVLINLLGNAIDQIETHQPPLLAHRRGITVRAQLQDSSILVQVQDRAGGIDAAHIDRVFEPFFTTKTVGSGTGLGLSISYGIVKDMGGRLTVTDIGGGACFQIELPASIGASPSVG